MEKPYIYIGITLKDEDGTQRNISGSFEDKEHAIAFLNREV